MYLDTLRLAACVSSSRLSRLFNAPNTLLQFSQDGRQLEKLPLEAINTDDVFKMSSHETLVHDNYKKRIYFYSN